MLSFVSGYRAAIVALLLALAAGTVVPTSPAAAAQQSATLNGLRYDLVSAKRMGSVGAKYDTARAQGTFLVLRFRISNATDRAERAQLLHAYLVGAANVRYRVASNATEILSAGSASENTLQEVHPHFPISVVIAFDVPASARKFDLHIVAHYPPVGIDRVMQIRV